MFREALAQEIQQGGIFFLLQHDLVQEFFSKKLLLLSRQSENFGNAFDDHDASTAEGLQGSIPNMDGWGAGWTSVSASQTVTAKHTKRTTGCVGPA